MRTSTCDFCGSTAQNEPTDKWIRIAIEARRVSAVGDLCPVCIDHGGIAPAVSSLLGSLGVSPPDVLPPEQAFAPDPLVSRVYGGASGSQSLPPVSPPSSGPQMFRGVTIASESDLAQFATSWVSVHPRERHQLAKYAFGGGENSPFVAAMRAAGGIEPVFRAVLGDVVNEDVQSRFATQTCPAPGLTEIVDSVVMIGSTVGMPADLRPLPIPDAVVEMLKTAPAN